MGLSIQTNVTSLIAQQNLRTNTAFQGQTIQQLTSGYRINSSGDDAAGLAAANKYRGDTAELTQGVRNANDAVGVLQTIDGGISNISSTIDRLRTLATQSASSTFTGNRATVNNEYQSLVTEINRQASNIGLNTGGKYNTNIGVYIGGGSSQANAGISIDLSGNNNAVDATALGLANTNVSGGGTDITGNAVRLDDSAVKFLAGSGTQAFTFNTATSTGAANTVVATVTAGANGTTGADVITQLNTQLAASGITASIGGSNGQLEFSSSNSFSLQTVGAATGGGNAAAGGTSATNTGSYNVDSGATFAAPTATETLTIQNGSGSTNVTLATTITTAAQAVQSLNTQLKGTGITAIVGQNGTNVSFQSQDAFSVNETTASGNGGLFNVTGGQTVTGPAANATGTGNALAALTALQAAVTTLGLTQGHVGSGENLLANAVNLAQSQITNFSAANSRIRDADIATEAANLTKAQVLQQSSIAALSQANSAPQQLLSLLK